MGKPLSRPDCLRQNPHCLGKGDEDEAYIEDCYVPQRSIYDTMRINEQIDQGTKLCQPSRSTLGSGGEMRGEGSTLSSNGTIGADIGGVFVSRNAENTGGVKKLDERVIFDALKLTGDLQIISPPVGIVGSSLTIAPTSSGGMAAVTKRRFQGSDKRDNPNRRSWKAFLPPNFPEFAERLEVSSAEGAEKRLSGAGTLSPLQAIPSHLSPTTPTSSTPSIPLYTPSPLSSAPHTPFVSSSPSLTPTVTPVPPLLQPPLSRQKQVHPVLHKQQKQTHMVPSQPAFGQAEEPHASGNTPQQSPSMSREVVIKKDGHRRTTSSSKAGIKQVLGETVELLKTSDSERDSPVLDHDQGDNAPLIPPKPVFCPPTKARTWPRSITKSKRTQVSLRHNFPVLPPLPPLLGEDSNVDEESLYLLDPPSPFVKEDRGLLYGGLPLSPCISQEGGDEGLLRWGAQDIELRERTASDLKFEEDERRILAIEEQEQKQYREMMKEKDKAEEDRALREEQEWEAVLKLEHREIIDHSWDRETLESEGWGLTGSSGHWPLLTPPMGFGGSGMPSVSPCPSSGAESDDLFLELERQCQEDEEEERTEMCVDSQVFEPYNIPCLEKEEKEREEETKTVLDDFEGTLPLNSVNFLEPSSCFETFTEDSNLNQSKHKKTLSGSEWLQTQHCEKEHSFIDKECDVDYNEDKVEFDEEEMSYPTDSALGQQLESDSSGVHIFQPDRTGITNFKQESHTQTETDPDSGASSEHDDDYEEGVSSTSQSPLNPYSEEVEHIEEEVEQDEGKLKEEEELGTEWDVYDQSEPSLDSSEGMLTDPASTPLLRIENEISNACGQDVHQTFCQEDVPPLDISKPAADIICDIEGMEFASDTFVVPVDVSDPNLETTAELTTSTSKSDPFVPLDPQYSDSAPTSSSPRSPSTSDSRGTGLESKDSEAFVISDSFVYLAVSAPVQYPNDCPPSPLGDSTSLSPVPKTSCGPEAEEDRAILSPDSFVYMAAPERPQPGFSEVCSVSEDTQDQYLDSCSEGTQSGVDGVEFVLGSVTGDSDWESDGSTLDLPPLVFTDQPWDQLEPGVLESLFAQSESGQAPVYRPQEIWLEAGDTICPKDLHLESRKSPNADNESTTILSRSNSVKDAKVCFNIKY